MIVKRSVAISGHATSISVEDRFWDELRRIAGRRDLPIAAMIAEIDAVIGHPPLRAGRCPRPSRERLSRQAVEATSGYSCFCAPDARRGGRSGCDAT